MSQQCEDPLNKFMAKDRDLPACPMRSAGNANSQMQILAFRGVSGPKARHDSVDGLAKGTGHYAINSEAGWQDLPELLSNKVNLQRPKHSGRGHSRIRKEIFPNFMHHTGIQIIRSAVLGTHVEMRQALGMTWCLPPSPMSIWSGSRGKYNRFRRCGNWWQNGWGHALHIQAQVMA